MSASRQPRKRPIRTTTSCIATARLSTRSLTFLRRLAVVARDLVVHAGGKQLRRHRVEPRSTLRATTTALVPFFFAIAMSTAANGPPTPSVRCAGPNVIQLYAAGSAGPSYTFGDVADAHRHAVDDVDRQVAQRRRVADARVGLDEQLRVRALQLTARHTHVRRSQREQHVVDGSVARRHGGRVDVDAQFTRAPADHFDAIRVGNCLQVERDFLREPPQVVVIDVRAIAPQRRDDDRNVVDLDGLHDP